MTTPSIVRIE